MCFDRVIEYLEECRRQKWFPGAVVGIRWHDKNHYFSTGTLSDEPNSSQVNANSIYDLASLTKPVATATAILLLIQEKSIHLDEPISKHLSEFQYATDKSAITIRSLLTHTSGLTAWEPVYILARSRREMIECIAAHPLAYPVGERVEYSCLGFLLLAEIVSRSTGKTLAEFCDTYIFSPLKMNSTLFNPPEFMRARIAPTEWGNEYERRLSLEAGYHFDNWRQYRIHGQVHDGNAYFAGGEGGNAGLFSSVTDLLRFGNYILSALHGGDSIPLQPQTILQATSNQTTGLNNHRGFGWQMADSSQAVKGILSDSAFGHNGFTGTSFWIDPSYQIAIVLLTNRVFYSDSRGIFNTVRARFHELVMGSTQGN